jgi:hypothetical protein
LNAEFVSELETRPAVAERTWRARFVNTLGPATVLVGVAWALWQPYRVTLLHPAAQSFWWLVVEPPLLVIAVGLVFHFLVVPGVLEDLEAEE